MARFDMSTQVKIDDGFIVFSKEGREFYDISIDMFEGYVEQMRLKRWFTADVEEAAVNLQTTSGSKLIGNQ
jgi:hypothetical protein